MGLRAVESGKLIDLSKPNSIIEYNNAPEGDEGIEYEQENVAGDWVQEEDDAANDGSNDG